mmetsp:Transcript_38748/g.115223  ORF Transcript_38748/g.115223 Transcript_38748/m.115223 type:complete len:286 (-) Transcript_38748:449-1306(-)
MPYPAPVKRLPYMIYLSSVCYPCGDGNGATPPAQRAPPPAPLSLAARGAQIGVARHQLGEASHAELRHRLVRLELRARHVCALRVAGVERGECASEELIHRLLLLLAQRDELAQRRAGAKRVVQQHRVADRLLGRLLALVLVVHLGKVGTDDGDWHRKRQDTCEHCNGGHNLAPRLHREGIAVPDGGHRHDGPPEGGGDGGEGRHGAVGADERPVHQDAALCVPEQRRKDEHGDRDEDDEHLEPLGALRDRLGEELQLGRVAKQPHQPHDSHDSQDASCAARAAV